MRNILKKWWFWLIIGIILIVLIFVIKEYQEKKQMEDKFFAMGESATDFYEGIKTAEGYLDEFTYNYEAGEVEYKPTKNNSWLEKYNLVSKGMTVKQVIDILGEGYISPIIDEVTYFMNWGEKEGLEEGQIITIQFNNEIVYLKTQIGLE